LKSYSTEAFVLRIRPLGEADRIIILFSRDRGKIDAVARGARRPGSRLGGKLDFFARVNVMLHAGRTLDTITSVHTVRAIWEQLVNPERFVAASYVAEVVDALSEPGMAVPELYDALCEFQEALASAKQLDLLLAAMNVRILDALGFSPELDACSRCGTALGKRPLFAGRAWLAPQTGGLLCNACVRSLRQEANSLDILSLSAADFSELRRLRNEPFGLLDQTKTVEPSRQAALNRVTRLFVEYQMGRRSKAQSISAMKVSARKR
jgi:DNA repair protein RecO (recombination protein O)